MKSNWMRLLGAHYGQMRNRYQDDRLLIIFDIDGTILDMRHVILHTLQAVDRQWETTYFTNLRIADINIHEAIIEPFLDKIGIPPSRKDAVVESYWRNLWSSTSVWEAHKPFRGVLEVIGWFQRQPRTFVGLNTGRPEALRFNTLNSLNRLGKPQGVKFHDDLLFMAPDDWKGEMPEIKTRGIEHFQTLGYRVFAMIDNEPENLEAIVERDKTEEILPLHARTIFKSRAVFPIPRMTWGDSYDPSDLTYDDSFRRSA